MLIERARRVALAYTRNLPNFICTQTNRDFKSGNGYDWRQTEEAAAGFETRLTTLASDVKLLRWTSAATSFRRRSLGLRRAHVIACPQRAVVTHDEASQFRSGLADAALVRRRAAHSSVNWG